MTVSLAARVIRLRVDGKMGPYTYIFGCQVGYHSLHGPSFTEDDHDESMCWDAFAKGWIRSDGA